MERCIWLPLSRDRWISPTDPPVACPWCRAGLPVLLVPCVEHFAGLLVTPERSTGKGDRRLEGRFEHGRHAEARAVRTASRRVALWKGFVRNATAPVDRSGVTRRPAK